MSSILSMLSSPTLTSISNSTAPPCELLTSLPKALPALTVWVFVIS